jgi:hypothetical protein
MEEEHLEILPECTGRFGDIRVDLTVLKGDVSHVKGRIDNGMSKTISEIHDMITALKPKIEHHASVIKRIEDAGWAMAYMFGALLLGVVIWAIGKGFVSHTI